MQRRTDRVTILGAARLGALNKCCVLCWWGRAVGPPAVKTRRSSLTGNPLTRYRLFVARLNPHKTRVPQPHPRILGSDRTDLLTRAGKRKAAIILSHG
jgi:hypothetical protein